MPPTMTEHEPIGLEEYQRLIQDLSQTEDGADEVLRATAATFKHLASPVHSIIKYEKLPIKDDLFRAHVAAFLREGKF